MEEIIKIPSRRIPGKKIGLNAALSTLGLTTTGIVTTNAIKNNEMMGLLSTATNRFEQDMEGQINKHDSKIKRMTELNKRNTPSGRKEGVDDINKQLGESRINKSGICKTEIKHIRDSKVKEHCLKDKTRAK